MTGRLTMELPKMSNRRERIEHRGISNMFMAVAAVDHDDAIPHTDENIAGIVLERLKGHL
jgi:hypothetical protein